MGVPRVKESFNVSHKIATSSRVFDGEKTNEVLFFANNDKAEIQHLTWHPLLARFSPFSFLFPSYNPTFPPPTFYPSSIYLSSVLRLLLTSICSSFQLFPFLLCFSVSSRYSHSLSHLRASPVSNDLEVSRVPVIGKLVFLCFLSWETIQASSLVLSFFSFLLLSLSDSCCYSVPKFEAYSFLFLDLS